MADLTDLAFPFRVQDLPVLALAIQDVPRPLWGDVAARRLRPIPGFRPHLLDSAILEGVYNKLLDKAPQLLGKTAEKESVLAPYERHLEVISPLQVCIFFPDKTPLTPTEKCLSCTGARAVALPQAVTYVRKEAV